MAKIKDPVSGITHLVGAVLSIIGLVLLIVFCALYSNEKAWDIVSCSIFGTALILLYLFSTLYHMLNLGETGTRVFRKFDHIMIFILIAATYTPICLGPIRGPWGWTIFGIVWGMAVLGTILTAVWINLPRKLTTSIYIMMGWTVLIAVYPMLNTFSKFDKGIEALLWLLAGGIFYTIGGIIYAKKWPKFNFKYWGFHEIFHVFVMLGSFCQFWFVFRYLIYM